MVCADGPVPDSLHTRQPGHSSALRTAPQLTMVIFSAARVMPV